MSGQEQHKEIRDSICIEPSSAFFDMLPKIARGLIKKDNQFLEYTATKLPFTLMEQRIIINTDKIFASLWINEDQLLLGTKCNKLLLVHVSGKIMEIPFLQSSFEKREGCVGIHTIVVNKTRTLAAVGAGYPCLVVIYEFPGLKPISILNGHKDVIFGATFISDYILATACRDGNVGFFKLTNEPQISPICFIKQHKTRVRDIKYKNNLYSISSDACLLWDIETMQVIRSCPLSLSETVCLEAKSQIYIGSQTQVTFLDLDLYTRSLVQIDDAGVRSIKLNKSVLSLGGGSGTVSFLETRQMNFLNSLNLPEGPALYTLQYSPDKTRLFLGGGPLQVSTRGSYASIW